MKVALFDFCETLVDFQTADAFVAYVREVTKNKRMNRINTIHSLLIKMQIIKVILVLIKRSSINKRLVLYQLKGFNRKDLNNYAVMYYNDKIKPAFILPVIEELRLKDKQGYDIAIVSGGYDIYLKCFAEEFNITNVICTKIKFRGDVCVGKFEGIDCLWENKITLLDKYFKRENIDKNNSYAFSDSKSDLSMLKWLNNGVVVSKNKHQVWSTDNNLKEIIWEK